jgi:hypothetical protein
MDLGLQVKAGAMWANSAAGTAALAVPNEEYTKRNWKGALEGYLAAGRRMPNDWFIEYRIGMCQLMMNQPAEAAGRFERSFARRARPVAAFFLGGAQAGNQRLVEAFGWYRKALELTLSVAAGNVQNWVPGESEVLAPALVPELYRQLAELAAALQAWDEGLASLMRAGLAALTGAELQQRARSELARVDAAMGRYGEVYGLLGRTVRLGIQVQAAAEGMRITNVDKGMPADLAGIRAADVMTSLNRYYLPGMPAAEFGRKVMPSLPFGTWVGVSILRGGQPLEVQVMAGVPPGTPVVAIRQLTLGPNPVAVGAPFQAGVEYAVTDPAALGRPLAAELSYTILHGNQVVFDGHALPAPAVSGEVQRVVQSFTGLKVSGTFTVKAMLRYAGPTSELGAS